MSSDSTGTLPYDTGRPISSKPPLSRNSVVKTFVEVAALTLTTKDGAVLAAADLVREANEIGNRKITMRELQEAINDLPFLREVDGGWILTR